MRSIYQGHRRAPFAKPRLLARGLYLRLLPKGSSGGFDEACGLAAILSGAADALAFGSGESATSVGCGETAGGAMGAGGAVAEGALGASRAADEALDGVTDLPRNAKPTPIPIMANAKTIPNTSPTRDLFPGPAVAPVPPQVAAVLPPVCCDDVDGPSGWRGAL
jgi:hypothetical protein